MSALSVPIAVELAGRDTPERPSLLLLGPRGVRQVSAGELADAAAGWAIALGRFDRRDPGAGPRVVVIVLRHGLEAYASFLGAMRAGMVPCFLPPPTPKQDPALYWSSHRAVLARIEPAVVVTSAMLLDELRAVLDPLVPLVDAASPPEGAPSAVPPIESVGQDHAPALLQHSSGTTGLKKGVVLTYGQVRNQVVAYAAAMAMRAGDTVASWLPLYHDMGLVTGFLMPLSLGCTIVAMDPFDWLDRPDSILRAIARFRATFCWLPNFAFAHLVATADPDAIYDLSSIRALVDCSEPCRADTLDAFQARFAPHGLGPGAITACYAMAETVFAVTQGVPGRPRTVLPVDGSALSGSSIAARVAADAPGAVRLVSCGAPIEGTRVRIVPLRVPWRKRFLAAMSRPLGTAPPAGVRVGEIEVASPSTFQGYYGDPAASLAARNGDWYRTGDLGILDDGELYVTGRLKDLIIVNGRNFYAHDIEAVASLVPGVKPGRAVAFAVDRASAGSDAAILLAESATSTGPEAAALARRVRAAVFDVLGLTLHHVGIRGPGVLVKTTSGKPCRHENQRLYAANGAA